MRPSSKLLMLSFAIKTQRCLRSERLSSYYLQQTEARWNENDEAVIRDEVRRLNDSMRPYFDAGRHLFEVDRYMMDRTNR